jgi:hypothetical protein
MVKRYIEPSVPQYPIIYITDIVLEDRRAIFEGFECRTRHEPVQEIAHY